jgi:outer membrane protein TolC
VNFVALNMKRLLTVGLVLTAGCAVGPDYHPPKTKAPGNWSEAQVGGATNAPVQFTDWWKTFHDPELDSLIERAVKANYDLRIAEAQLLQARALRSGAVWAFTPSINGSASFMDRQISRNAQTGSATNTVLGTHLYDAGFDASWEIDIFGGLRRQLQQANAQYASVEDQRRVVLISVMAEVARNYVDVRGFQKRISINHENIIAQHESVEIARARFNAVSPANLMKQAESYWPPLARNCPHGHALRQRCINQRAHRSQPGALLMSWQRPPIPPPPEAPIAELLPSAPDVHAADATAAAT